MRDFRSKYRPFDFKYHIKQEEDHQIKKSSPHEIHTKFVFHWDGFDHFNRPTVLQMEMTNEYIQHVH